MRLKTKIVNKKRDIRKQNVMQLALSLLAIVLINLISFYLFSRIDLTSEKRYSLSPVTKDLIRNLDDIVYFKVYLDGEFPAGFKRLRNETREMLDELRAYNGNIEYEFIDPSAIKDKKDRNNLYRSLAGKGLEPTELQVKTDDGSSQQIIFPGALVTYKGVELPMQLLNSQVNTAPEVVLNSSVQALEYNISSTIRKLANRMHQKIAFTQGHGELKEIEVGDITRSLSEFYDVERVNLNGQISSLTDHDISDSTKARLSNKYAAIIIAKPDSAFNEKDKFIIDQYIMHGGKVLWLIDPISASMDSLSRSGETMGLKKDLKLEDQLFRYGARLNANLVMDLSACPIPIKTGVVGNQPQFEYFPWYFFPIVSSHSKHPIVNNLNSLRGEFMSSIDTISVPGVKQTILLTSSAYSRLVTAPALISLRYLKRKPDPRMFGGPPASVALLLEGTFPSLYKKRMAAEIAENPAMGFLEESKPTKMLIVSDGDIIHNYFDKNRNIPLPLGYDRYTRQTYGNSDFIMNAINYLCDDSGLISVRARDLKLRMLDSSRIREDKLKLQLINAVFPIVLLVLFGVGMSWRRRKKYSSVS
ncbi:MAG: gliding motility-associated ABC transporter substrate-binding protein GldG [Bacteroidota bacterium]